MNYQEARAYIRMINEKSGSVLGLERIEKLMHWLGDPQDDLHIVHIAGTNGKGSCGAILSSILMQAGYRVGRYVSPAVLDDRESIQIDGEWIKEEEMALVTEEIKMACDTHCKTETDYPTSFEIETAMAFFYFKKMKVDIVLLEVGLGGLSDATNVIKTPSLSVITSISYDHMAFLGNTLEAIAAQKAGIIKNHCPVLIADQSESVMSVVATVAEAKAAPLYRTHRQDIHILQQNLTIQQFDYQAIKNLTLHLIGSYQIENSVLALSAAQILTKCYPDTFMISENHIREGLNKAQWQGRFEKVWDDPVIIVDGAHNPDGAMALKMSAEACLKDYEIILLAGIFKDKDYKKILEVMADISREIYTHTAPGPRGLKSSELAEAAKAYYDHVTDCSHIEAALAAALDRAKELKQAGNPVAILSFGSLSTIFDLKNWLRNQINVL